MLDNPSAAEVLKACGVDIEELRGVLTDFINEHTPRLSPHSDADTQPTQGFQRVIQRAILHVQSSGKKEVTGANVLVAIFGEKESHAVYFLNQRGVTRLDVVNYIAHADVGMKSVTICCEAATFGGRYTESTSKSAAFEIGAARPGFYQ